MSSLDDRDHPSGHSTRGTPYMPRGPLKVKVSEIRRTLRAVQKEGEHAERIEVDFEAGNFAVVLARGDKPHRSQADVMREVEEILAAMPTEGAAA
jgi:hypothetical protein